MRKTELSVALIREWRQLMFEHPDYVRDALSEEELAGQLPSFYENRHDQTFLTLLVYKYLSKDTYKNKIASVWEFHKGWWIFGNPAVAMVRQRSADAYRMSVKARIRRLAYRVLWRLQMMLERQGLQICWAKTGF